jgi:hypothetical protein
MLYSQFDSIILIFGNYEHQAYPRKAELQVDTLNAAYHYTSTPEDGMPRLPFKNTSKRKANEEPVGVGRKTLF